MPEPISRYPTADPRSSKHAIDWIEMLRRYDGKIRQTITAQLIGGHEEAVDDIMQEVAIAATKSQSTPTSEEKALPWLRQIARHKIQDHWRKFHRQQHLNAHWEQSAVETRTIPTPYEWVLQIESQNAITDALQKLPKDDRELLIQKYSQAKRCAEIASATGLSIKSIEYRLSRARNTLRKILTSQNEA